MDHPDRVRRRGAEPDPEPCPAEEPVHVLHSWPHDSGDPAQHQRPVPGNRRLLGGTNIANLLLRFIICGAIFFLGLRIAAGFGDERGLRLVRGRAGMLAFGLVSVALLVSFLLMDTAGSSVGMSAVDDRNEWNAVLVEYYAAAGRAYPAYVCLVLLPGMVRAFRSSLPAVLRTSALLLAVGSAAIAITVLFPLIPPAVGYLKFVINYTAILCLVAGLALIWLASGRAGRRRGAQSVGRR